MHSDRYVVVEIPAEATTEQYEAIAEEVLGHVADMNDSDEWGVDVFGYVPHTHQEDVLRELFGGFDHERGQ